MLRDVFYYGSKPNVHPREKFATSLEDARNQSSTEHFWIINEYCDYRNFDWDFDFEFLPDEDVWAEEHNNVWPSQHQKDSGTWLCATKPSNVIIYRSDVDAVKRKNIKHSNWVLLDLIDESKFDFSWHPDPTDPPYIYTWGCKYFPVELQACLEYHVADATTIKYMNAVVELLPQQDRWVEVQEIDKTKFDLAWRPSPLDPPMTYVWGNKYIDGTLRSTLEYHMPDSVETKYMPNLVAVLPEWDRWEMLHPVDKTSFDFTWRPDPREPSLIYVFGNDQHPGNIMSTIEYRMPDATERKYIDDRKAKLLPQPEKYHHLEDSYGIDYTWVPNPTSPPYIYAWGNQWNKPEDKISIQYIVEGATEYRYMEERATRRPSKDNWEIPDDVDTTGFDFSWEPSPADPAYIYEFGTQWQKTGGPRYVVEGATEVKYIGMQSVKSLVSKKNWTVPENVDVTDFDFSWHPDATSPAYIYRFATQWAMSGGPIYTVPGATEVKYVDTLVAKALPNRDNWEVHAFIDIDSFDFSWHPYAEDEPYIYQFGTQWQKTGGPRYLTPGVHKNSPVKYIDTRIIKAKRLPNKQNFNVVDSVAVIEFDYSWHPDATDEPFIYVFGNNQYPAEIMPTIQYVSQDAVRLVSGKPIGQIKYVNDIVATLGENKDNWEIPNNIDATGFDFSWVPNPKDPAYIYEFGTQWQKTGGPRYVVEGATEVKYVDNQTVKKYPSFTNWEIPDNVDATDFDFSWHPDATSPAYIYRFATQWAMSGGPIYTVPGATEVKYVEGLVAKALPNRDNWEVPAFIDVEGFDFSWHPYAEDEPYIYQFGTQWQKTGGPRYLTPGIHKNSLVKYIDTRIIKAKRLPNLDNFIIPVGIIVQSFDYSWHHDETDDPYIYQFGTQWHDRGGPSYVAPGIANLTSGKFIGQIKYVTDIVAVLGENKKNWSIPNNIDATGFDFSWVPHPDDPAYIYQFGTQWQQTGGPRYEVEGATEVKYVDIQQVKALPSNTNWEIPDNVDVTDFDFSWHPYAEDEPYIYQFGTQWQKTGGPRYLTPGIHKNSPVKYIDNRIIKAKRLPNKDNFVVVSDAVVDSFDYSWHPDATDEPFIYVFGNTQYPAEIMPTIQYVPQDAVRLVSGKPIGQLKYVHDIVATLQENKTNWEIPDDIDASTFDFSWIPHPFDDPFIYQFGTQWQKTGGPRYIAEGAIEVKYVDTQHAKKMPDINNWYVPKDIDIKSFDFSWHPDSTEAEPYIYIFGTQHQKTSGPQYVSPGIPRLASGKPIGQIKYIDPAVLKATILPNMTNWTNPKNADVSMFDFSWHPDDTSPPTSYQFGTLLDREDGPKYIHPNTLDDVVVYLERIEKPTVDSDTQLLIINKYEIKTTLEDLIKQHPNELFWAINPDLDYTDFNFDWRPSIEQSQYVHAFGSSASEKTQTYLVNSAMWEKGFKELNWVEDKKLDDETLFKLFKKSDMFFVDRSNSESKERFEQLKQKFPNIQKTRYLNSWVDTINRCINRSTTELCWILNSELDYSNFNFEYYPNPWQMKMVQVFGTQWSHWGTTFMVNRETFAEDTKFIKIIEHLSNLNFVKDRRAKATNVLYDIVYIDHGNMDMTKLIQEGKTVVKYQNSYITTLQKMIDILPVKKEHYVWVASTVCDYTEFDFTYICDPFAREQLHVFPSDRQKFGDTFLIDVNKLRILIEDMNALTEYEKINYNQSQRAKRLPAPTIITNDDTHVSGINTEFKFPYAVFTTADNKDINIVDSEPMSLWTPESKNIQITSVGGTRIVVPKEAKEYVKRELYDYPYIITNSRLAKSSPMDIVFLSNGETGAEENYQHLLKVTSGLPNKVIRVDGVNGRVAAYHAAAQASTTAWMFTVFAKLKVSNKFDWNWQPDRLQIPKHYVFHASNPVNGLKYGHMAMIAYNKKLTLVNEGKGLDFTMDDEHEIVEINSGIANFNTDEWSTWRTSFREALKLRTENSEISKTRLDMWLTVGMGKFNEYSTEGAQHAVEYYEEVKGDFEKLKLSYDWPWLRAYYEKKYPK